MDIGLRTRNSPEQLRGKKEALAGPLQVFPFLTVRSYFPKWPRGLPMPVH
jgi:hypothetical protein